jgi:hypothetical protein
MMSRITSQQTLGALPNHRKRLFLRSLQAASVHGAKPFDLVDRDPPVGIVTRNARRVVSTRRGLK